MNLKFSQLPSPSHALPSAQLDHDLANIVQLVAELAIRKSAEAYGIADSDFLPPISDDDLLYPETYV